jgi:hypothetical protein
MNSEFGRIKKAPFNLLFLNLPYKIEEYWENSQ